MTATGFDPVQFKQQQRVNWDAISAGWLSIQEIFERGGSAMTAHLLDLADLRAGQSVLDAGTGTGEPAITASGVVGPTGRVLGVDIAPAMVALASTRAEGLDHVEFAVGDVDDLGGLDGSFDVVLSRWGLMFAADRVAALRSVRHVLRPGGVLAAAVWGPPSVAPMVAVGFRVFSAALDLPAPPPGAPGPFSMADADEVTGELWAAGFTDVSVTEFTVPFVLDSVAQYVEFTKAVTIPPLLAMLRDKYGPDDSEIWDALAEAVSQYRTADGAVALPSTALCLRAVRPD